jgi:hypothetical protein
MSNDPLNVLLNEVNQLVDLSKKSLHEREEKNFDVLLEELVLKYKNLCSNKVEESDALNKLVKRYKEIHGNANIVGDITMCDAIHYLFKVNGLFDLIIKTINIEDTKLIKKSAPPITRNYSSTSTVEASPHNSSRRFFEEEKNKTEENEKTVVLSEKQKKALKSLFSTTVRDIIPSTILNVEKAHENRVVKPSRVIGYGGELDKLPNEEIEEEIEEENYSDDDFEDDDDPIKSNETGENYNAAADPPKTYPKPEYWSFDGEKIKWLGDYFGSVKVKERIKKITMLLKEVSLENIKKIYDVLTSDSRKNIDETNISAIEETYKKLLSGVVKNEMSNYFRGCSSCLDEFKTILLTLIDQKSNTTQTKPLDIDQMYMKRDREQQAPIRNAENHLMKEQLKYDFMLFLEPNEINKIITTGNNKHISDYIKKILKLPKNFTVLSIRTARDKYMAQQKENMSDTLKEIERQEQIYRQNHNGRPPHYTIEKWVEMLNRFNVKQFGEDYADTQHRLEKNPKDSFGKVRGAVTAKNDEWRGYKGDLEDIVLKF